MTPALQSLHDEIVSELHGRLAAPAPSGAAVFPLPSIDLLPLVEGTAKLALSQLVATFGGAAEDFVTSHREQVKAVVADNVLAFAAKVVADLQSR